MTREEFQDRCRVRRLNIGDSVSAFDCYDEDLNDFILNEASLYRNALLSVTYVVEDKITDEVLAYFSLSNDKISISDFENKTDFNRFRKHKFTNQKRLRSYPAIKNRTSGNSQIGTAAVYRHLSSGIHRRFLYRGQQIRLQIYNG